MASVAVAIFCKTPAAGLSKTRLSPPLRPEQCSVLSACFISDLAATVHELAIDGSVTPYAVYTPIGSEPQLRELLPLDFRLLAQSDSEFGTRIFEAMRELLSEGHSGAILLNADSPTLPASILSAAVAALRRDNAVVLGPAIDGGYTLVGLSRPHKRLFEDIAWSTADVYRTTVERAVEVGLPVVQLPHWYDVDDGRTLQLLEAELAGERLPHPLCDSEGAKAPATRRFLQNLRASRREGASC